jgi:N-acetylglucosaminyldiphosphoundecaprenol N-acetyl-beta-D-mannosaminyltransferase
MTVNFINAHIFNICWKDVTYRQLINSSDIIAADGMSIVWAAKLFGFTIPGRCNMTDTFRVYLSDRNSPASTAILIGGSDQDASKAAAAIQRDGPHLSITSFLSGYHTIPEYMTMLKKSDPPDFVLVGMGSPKSEQLIEAVHALWPGAIVWHIGGGTIMFFAGSLAEAPAWMRRCGLQWLHRLMIEPGRMWKRYIIGNPQFVFRVLKSAMSYRRTANENESK